MKGSRYVAVAAVVVVLAGLTLPTAAAQTPSPSPQKLTFTYGSTNDIDSLNPFVGVEAPAYFTYYLTYDMLVSLSVDDLSPAPGLAESWETSPDGKTWTFNIRQGVKWHDGEPVTAHDVEYTYDRIIEEQQGNYVDYLDLVDTVTATDDYTVEIVMKRPSTQLLSALVYILPEHVWKDVSKKESKTYENCCPVIGSGPFRTVEWRKGQFVRLEANKGYWGGRPHLDEIIYRIFNNNDAVAQALRSGEIDYTDGLNANLFNSLKNQPAIATHEATIPSFDEIGFNTGADETIPDSNGHPALKDPRVRQAMHHAIDKQTLVERILLGYGEVGTTIVPPFSAAYHYEPTPEERIDFDPQEANRILDEAGYEDTDGDGIREMPNGGRPLEFRYFVRSENNDTVKTSEFVTEWLRDVGIGTNVQSMTDTKLTDVIYAGNYDMFHWGWFPDPDPDFILSVMTCGQRPPNGVWSDSFYCDEDYDRMYQEQKGLVDIEERAEVIKEMQRQVYLASPYVVLYYDTNLQAYRKDRWTGFRMQPARTGDLVAGYGNAAFVSIRPVSATTTAAAQEGTSPVVWIAVAAAGILLIGALVLLRRRSGAEERE